MQQVKCNRGHFVIFDGSVNISGYSFYCGERRLDCYKQGMGHSINAARLVIHVPPSLEPDHKNGDNHDNRLHNLRVVTKQQNAFNRKRRSDSKNTYKGVQRNGSGWAARITKGKDRFNLGTYPREEDAALAYNEAAKRLFGEYARLNIIRR